MSKELDLLLLLLFIRNNIPLDLSDTKFYIYAGGGLVSRYLPCLVSDAGNMLETSSDTSDACHAPIEQYNTVTRKQADNKI